MVSLASFYIAYFAFEPAPAVTLFKHIGFWTMTLTFGLFVFFLFRVLRDEWKRNPKFQWKTAALFAGVTAAGSLLMYKAEEPGFKMIMDDHAIASVSMQLHYNRVPIVPTRVIQINSVPYVASHYVDKRPIFFHYLGALVSDLTGFRPKNTVYLNLGLGVVLMALVFGFGRSLGGNMAGIASVALLISAPMISHLATGGGMEPCNLVMIVATMWLGAVYLRTPNNNTFGAFTTAGILLSQSRYESIVFLLPVALTVLAVWIRERKISIPDFAFVCPVLLIPYVLQNKVYQVMDAMWQMNDVTRGDVPFGFVYFFDNLSRSLLVFFETQPTYGNSVLLSLAGVIALIALLIFGGRRYREFFDAKPAIQAFTIFMAGFFALFMLLMLYSWEIDQPIIRRLTAPLLLPLAFGAALLIFSLIRKRALHIIGFAVIGIYLLAATLPNSAKRRYSKENIATQDFKSAEKFMKEHAGERFIVISDNSAFFCLYNIECASWTSIANRKESVKFYLEQPGSADIYIFRRLVWEPVSGEYLPSDHMKLGDEFVTEVVWEDNFHEVHKTQFLRLIDIEGVEPAMPDQPFQDAGQYIHHWAENLP